MGEGVRGGLMEIGGVRMEWERCMWRADGVHGSTRAWWWVACCRGRLISRSGFAFRHDGKMGRFWGGGARGLGPGALGGCRARQIANR